MRDRRRKTRVVLGVTGSIAAYKSVALARYLIKRGCDVRVVLTDSASRFVTPFALATITGNPVTTTFWKEGEPGAIGHIELADWADVLVVAPASADSIAKLRYGFAETPLLAVALATKAPLVVAPAMNVKMFNHPATRENLEILQQRGAHMVEPESGVLACGWVGKGRLASPREIFAHIKRATSSQDLTGKKILITAGPTREAVDPVRFLSNRSSGKMGVALAREAYRRGATVTLVHGPIGDPRVPRGVVCKPVTTAAEMFDTVMSHVKSEGCDVAVMAAAVADYRPAKILQSKMKKSAEALSLELTPNGDILKALGESRLAGTGPFLVGFAVETGDVATLLSEARRKLLTKNADIVVGNLAEDSFDRDTNRVWIVFRDRQEQEVATASKSKVAAQILDAVISTQDSACILSPVQH